MNAIRIIFEFLGQIWMNEKEESNRFWPTIPGHLSGCKELTLSDAKAEFSKALQNHMFRHASGVGHEAQ
jgi:hypothetical protein